MAKGLCAGAGGEIAQHIHIRYTSKNRFLCGIHKRDFQHNHKKKKAPQLKGLIEYMHIDCYLLSSQISNKSLQNTSPNVQRVIYLFELCLFDTNSSEVTTR